LDKRLGTQHWEKQNSLRKSHRLICRVLTVARFTPETAATRTLSSSHSQTRQGTIGAMGPIEWLKRQQQQRRAGVASASLSAKKQSSRVWMLVTNPKIDAVAVAVGILLCVLGYIWHLRTANVKSNKSNKSTPKQAGNGVPATSSPGPLAYVKSLISTPLSAAASSASSPSSSTPQQPSRPNLEATSPPPRSPCPR
jgi:hypothetical protein